MKRNELDNFKEKILYLYKERNQTFETIAKTLNASTSGIYDAVRRWNVEPRNLSISHRKYSICENFFDIINTSEKAYWLGFIYADGFLVAPNSFGITLKSDDKSHLYKFLKSMDSNYAINDYKKNDRYGYCEYSRVLIRNQHIYNELINKGVFLRKSLILKYPLINILPNIYNKDFIRGYFDGDGSLILSKNSINFKMCGTREFLISVIKVLNNEVNYEFNQRLYKRKNDNKNNYYISYGGRNKTTAVMSYLYDNAEIFLDRKYEKYLKLINN